MPGIQVSNCSKSTINQKNNNDVIICWLDVIHKLFLTKCFSSSSVIGPSFMSISLLVPGIWQFLFERYLTRNPESEISPSQFCLISRDLGELVIPTLLWMSLIKIYVILQNPRLYSFYCFWVIKTKPTAAWGKNTPHYPD